MSFDRPGCSHHCRECSTCFTSLRAFDAHRAGTGTCFWPEELEWMVEEGVCNIRDETTHEAHIYSLVPQEASDAS